MLKRIKKSGGFSLIELLAVLAILSILMAVAVPATAGYIKSARRAAAYTESQIAADAVQLYLYDEKEAGRLTVGKLHKLMNLNLSDPENVLADYISGGQKNSRIVSVDADLKTGQLKKLIYENKFVKVSLTVDEDGTRNMEEDTMDKADYCHEKTSCLFIYFKRFFPLRDRRMVLRDPLYICGSVDEGRCENDGDYLCYHVSHLCGRCHSSGYCKMVRPMVKRTSRFFKS